MTNDMEEANMREKWRFMAPWCKALDVQLMSRSFHPNEGLQVDDLDLSGDPPVIKQQLEALALLAVVAHVDMIAWKFLLLEYWIQYPQDQDVIASFETPLPPSFLLGIPIVEGEFALFPVDPATNLPETVICRLDEHNGSDEYKASLSRIAEMQGLVPGAVPVEIQVPVCVQMDALEDEQAVETWTTLRQADIRQTSTLADAEQASRRAANIPFCVTFALRAFQADFQNVDLSPEIANLLEDMVSFVDDRVSCRCINFSLRSNEDENKLEAQNQFGNAARAIQNVICDGSKGARVRNVIVHTDDKNLWKMEALCSAFVVAQGAQGAHVAMAQRLSTPEHRRCEWEWLAYAFFSSRARSRSCIQDLELWGVYLTEEDAAAFAAILETSNPEAQLVGYPPGSSMVQAEDAREFDVKAGTRVHLVPIHHDLPMWQSFELALSRDICGVKILNDEGDSEWVDVLVPSLGKCQIDRSSLEACSHINSRGGLGRISVSIELDSDDNDNWEGLPHLLATVHPMLRRLKIVFRNVIPAAMQPALERILSTVRGILEANRTLEVFILSVDEGVASENRDIIKAIKSHDLEKIAVVQLPFPTECKRAFWSIFRQQAVSGSLKKPKGPSLAQKMQSYRLGHDVLCNIFDFAATCAKRKVMVELE